MIKTPVTTYTIYRHLESLADTDLWIYLEKHAAKWKTQVRWNLPPFDIVNGEQDSTNLARFAALLKRGAETAKTTKRTTAILKLLMSLPGHEMLLSASIPEQLDECSCTIDLIDADEDIFDPECPVHGTPPVAEVTVPSLAALVDTINAEVSADLETSDAEPQATPQDAPTPEQVQGVTAHAESVLAHLEAPKAAKARFEMPPPERRAAYMLAEVFRGMSDS